MKERILTETERIFLEVLMKFCHMQQPVRNGNFEDTGLGKSQISSCTEKFEAWGWLVHKDNRYSLVREKIFEIIGCLKKNEENDLNHHKVWKQHITEPNIDMNTGNLKCQDINCGSFETRFIEKADNFEHHECLRCGQKFSIEGSEQINKIRKDIEKRRLK